MWMAPFQVPGPGLCQSRGSWMNTIQAMNEHACIYFSLSLAVDMQTLAAVTPLLWWWTVTWIVS